MTSAVGRRGFLHLTGLAGASALTGCPLLPDPDAGTPAPDAGGLDDAGTDAAPPPPPAPGLADTGPRLARSWPKSYAAFNAKDTEFELRVVSGTLPTDMWGHYFINGPIPQGDPNAHPFNGDGMFRRVDFGGPTVFYKQRLAKTPCWYVDRALASTDHGFKNAGLARMHMDLTTLTSLGVRNQVNTGFQPIMDGRLVCTTDAGRPYEVDPDTLEIVTPVGAISEWRNGLFTSSGLPDGVAPIPLYGTLEPALGPTIGSVIGPMMEKMLFPAHFSSAHPVFDVHTGEMFTNNINFVANDASDPSQRFIDLVRWDGKGKLEKWTLKLDSGKNAKLVQSGHQMVVTELYVIIMDAAVNIELDRILDPSRPARPQLPTSVLYIVRRDELKPGGGEVRCVKAVVQGEAGHFTADYENPNGRIVGYFTHLIATDLSEWIGKDDVRFDTGKKPRAELVGFLPMGNDINTLGRHVIDGKSGRVLDSHVIADDDYTWATLFHYHRGFMNPGRYESIYWSSLGHNEELMLERTAELYRDHPLRRVPLEDMPNKTGKPSNLFHVDVQSMAVIDGYQLPPGRIMGSPMFIPRDGSTGWTDGYIVSIVLSDDTSNPDSSGDEFWVFDAQNLSQGPLARLGHPELDLCFTIHTTWMPEAKPRTASYQIKASDDYAARLDAINASAEVRAVFTKEIYPRFG